MNNQANTTDDLHYLYDLHKTMLNQKLILVYEGAFSQHITKSLLGMTERKMDLAKEENSIKRKIFNVMMECLQNICRHTNTDDGSEEPKTAIFMIGQDDSDYYIYTGNAVPEENVQHLKDKLKEVNDLDEDGLKAMYKEILRKGRISDKGGAGLGLIDIARKSGNKLYFDFQQLQDNSWFYSLRVKIPRNASKKN